jgi:predicted nucleic acid-binding protein
MIEPQLSRQYRRAQPCQPSRTAAADTADPIPFEAEAARAFGRVCAAVIAAGRQPRRRIADLMIASVALAEDLPLYTTNPDDFKGLEELITVRAVARPGVPHESGAG